MSSRRKHSKISQYPTELQEAINKRIVEGQTYAQITEWLNRMGHEISDEAVRRHGQDFLAKLERLKMVKEQAKVIVTETGDAPATQMAEAANQVAIDILMEALFEFDRSKMKEEKGTHLIKALSLVTKNSVELESLKLRWKNKIEEAFKKLREEIWAEVGTNPELYNQVIEYANRIEKKAVEAIE